MAISDITIKQIRDAEGVLHEIDTKYFDGKGVSDFVSQEEYTAMLSNADTELGEAFDRVYEYIDSINQGGNEAIAHFTQAIDTINSSSLKIKDSVTEAIDFTIGSQKTLNIIGEGITTVSANEGEIVISSSVPTGGNETKNYVYKNDPSPFNTLMNNINILLSCDIAVNVRLNIDKHNVDNMKELVSYIHNRFGNLDNLYIYTMPLFECTKSLERSDEDRKEIFTKTDDINQYLYELGYIGNYFNTSLPNSMCAADDGRSVMILPDGHLGLCEHHTDDEYIGAVDDVIYDFAKIREWKEKSPELDICKDCYFWPTCIKLTHCQEQHGCHIYDKTLKLNKEKRVLHNYFKMAKMSDYYISQLNKREG